jgi:class 3 adenylate cyclase
VAKYLGDGALVYFGYPEAHEDDPERAVRAGLELIAAVTALKSSVPLKTRVGITRVNREMHRLSHYFYCIWLPASTLSCYRLQDLVTYTL